MDVTVRRGTAVDAPALARLRWRWRTEERGEVGLDRGAFAEYFTGWVIDHLATHVPFVIELEGRLAGMAFLALIDRVPGPAHMDRRTGDIQSVYIVPELRNRVSGRSCSTRCSNTPKTGSWYSSRCTPRRTRSGSTGGGASTAPSAGWNGVPNHGDLTRLERDERGQQEFGLVVPARLISTANCSQRTTRTNVKSPRLAANSGWFTGNGPASSRKLRTVVVGGLGEIHVQYVGAAAIDAVPTAAEWGRVLETGELRRGRESSRRRPLRRAATVRDFWKQVVFCECSLPAANEHGNRAQA